MARQHPAGDHQIRAEQRLTSYPIAAVRAGPWPGRLALGPAPASPDAVAALKTWGPSVVLCLMEPDERAGMGLGALDQWVADAGMVFLEAPIDDFSSPDPAFLANWDALRDKLLAKLEAGEKVFLHCRAGLGRSGTITAALLVAGGLRPDDAIHAVRAVRLGAIETPGQVAWLRSLAP